MQKTIEENESEILAAESYAESKSSRETRLALLNILEDTDEARKKAEEERNRTLLIINNFADGLLVFDAKNYLSLFNPQAEKFFGMESGGLIGKDIIELEGIPGLAPLIKALGRELKSVSREELPLRENLIIEMSVLKIAGEETGSAGNLVILHDVTREKIIEKLKTEFVSLAAHQLRTPLSAIKWTLRMILDGDVGKITKEQKEMLNKTYISNERMIMLVNDLLNVTRIEEGRYLFKQIPADIGEILQSMINSYQEEAKKRNVALEYFGSKEKIPKLFLDVEKISLAFQNILDNAVRYTPAGGKVTVAIKNSGKKGVEISVKDTGVGIPQNQQERVFGKFFRAANVVRMETEGSGLGLFIAKNIIEAHGGKIWFESKEGKGTTFWLTLPAK